MYSKNIKWVDILLDTVPETESGNIKKSQGLCPHRVYSLEEMRNTKLGDNIGFISIMKNSVEIR